MEKITRSCIADHKVSVCFILEKKKTPALFSHIVVHGHQQLLGIRVAPRLCKCLMLVILILDIPVDV